MNVKKRRKQLTVLKEYRAQTPGNDRTSAPGAAWLQHYSRVFYNGTARVASRRLASSGSALNFAIVATVVRGKIGVLGPADRAKNYMNFLKGKGHGELSNERWLHAAPRPL